MSFASRAADVAHKTAVSGIFGLFLWQGFQLGGQMLLGVVDEDKKREHPQAGFIHMLKDKYAEEYKTYFDTGHRNWYDKDDNSHLKDIPRPRDYQPGGKRN